MRALAGLTLVGWMLMMTAGQAGPVRLRASSSESDVPVSAELQFQQNEAGLLSNFELRVLRQGRQVMRSPLPVEQLATYDPSFPVRGISADVKVLDLDASGEPEILVDLAEAGARCCASTFIYYYEPQTQQYQSIAHFWGNYTSGYWLDGVTGQADSRQLPDLSGDGVLEFVALDDRFRGEFGGYATSFAPVQIWRFRQGQMIDVTAEFPDIVYQNAFDLWGHYQQIRREFGLETARGAIAAYAGAKFRLGQGEDAMQRIRQNYPAAQHQAFLNELTTFLRDTGYAP